MLWYKRLEQGTFEILHLPTPYGGPQKLDSLLKCKIG